MASKNDLWPMHFDCFCGSGQQWWQPEQKRYACRTCQRAMTEDPNTNVIGVWNGTAPSLPNLTREQAWHRAPPNTVGTDIG